MATELATVYDPKSVEKEVHERWTAEGSFHADPAAEGESYCIVIPPPNVTAPLHLGTRSTTRCKTCSCASSACAAAMSCGSRAPTMPASPRKWWSSGN